MDLSNPLELPQRSWTYFPVVTGNSGFLSRCCKRIRPHVLLRQETRGSSGVLTGISGFLSSCNGDLRELLYLPQGSQASFLVVRGNSGFLSRVLQGNWASSRGEAGNSGFLLSCYRDLSENLEFL